MKFQVTEKHLDRAIALDKRSKCENCILSQAIQDHKEEVFVYNFGIETKKQDYKHSNETIRIMNLFDEEKYEDIRSELPLELEILIG